MTDPQHDRRRGDDPIDLDLDHELDYDALARRYLETLLDGDRRSASQMILDAVENGANIKRIYLEVFQWSQMEIGRRWQHNEVTVAQEHFCSAATQMIMSQLYPQIFATEKRGLTLVAGCVGGELHEIGVRMVADLFELEGWDAYYLGANTPMPTILETLEERRPDILGLSATMHYHVPKVRRIVDAVRDAALAKTPRVIVGGYSFQNTPMLWKKVGADGFAKDAQEAVAVAHRLLTEQSDPADDKPRRVS